MTELEERTLRAYRVHREDKKVRGRLEEVKLGELSEGDVVIRARYSSVNYKDALEQGLPLGSGEIESAHRYIVQNRMKIAGAWWKKDNAEAMLSLRICRVNGQWEGYWKSVV